MFQNFRPPPKKKNPHAKQNTNAKTETLNEEFTPEEAGVQWQPCGLISATSAVSGAGHSVWIVFEVGCRWRPGSAELKPCDVYIKEHILAVWFSVV